MTPIIGLLIILFFAILGARFVNRSIILNNPLISGLVVSGVPYIFLGVFLGPNFFNFLNADIISSLQPLVSLALGWVGIIFGIQLRWRNIRRYPRNYLIFSTVQSLVTAAVIFFMIWGFMVLFAPESYKHHLEAAIILAALGSATAPLTIARITIFNKARGRLTNLIQFISSLDSFWGITLAGMVFIFFHQPAVQWITRRWEWLILAFFIGIALGLVFRYLIQLRFVQEEILLLVLGLVIFTSGIGFYLRLSPIFLNMIVGVTLAQFPRESEKMMRMLLFAEKPIYLFLLVFAGALWNYHFWGEIFLILTFIVARYAGKYLGGMISQQNIDCAFPVPLDMGKSLMSFGGVSLAIAFNFHLFYGGFVGNAVLSTTILAIFAFDEYTAVTTLHLLRREGEIR